MACNHRQMSKTNANISKDKPSDHRRAVVPPSASNPKKVAAKRAAAKKAVKGASAKKVSNASQVKQYSGRISVKSGAIRTSGGAVIARGRVLKKGQALEIKLPYATASKALLRSAGLTSSSNQQELLRRARSGISFAVVESLRPWATREVLSSTIAPESTLNRWRKQGKELVGGAAEGALRLVALISLAEQAFGDAEKAGRWLTKPKKFLDPDRPRATPLELADTELGGRLVEERLMQIAHGIFA